MELIEILKNYVLNIQTDFAILLDGEWGCGKTYFLKNEFKEEIEKEVFLTKEKEMHYDVVYISLFGIQTVEQLQQKLTIELNPFLKTKAAAIGGMIFSKLGGMIGFDMKEEDAQKALNIFGTIPQNKILVFDDLERLPGDLLNEVLGFINNYTEHQGVKVIIIAHEKVLDEKVTDYRKIKEKLIRFTYTYQPDLAAVYPEFILRYDDDSYQKFLLNQKTFICQTFEKGQHKNLRTLRFVLDLFSGVFAAVGGIDQINDEYRPEILHRFLFFLMTYAIEYKKDGITDAKIEALKQMGSMLESGGLTLRFFDMPDKQEPEEEDNIKEKQKPDYNFSRQFERIYITSSGQTYHYYEFLRQFIHTGNLNKDVLADECIDININSENAKLKPEYVALRKFDNCLLLEDDEFDSIYKEVLHFVSVGTYPLKQYPNIFANIVNCEMAKVKGVLVDEELINLFKSAIDKVAESAVYEGKINEMRHYQEPEALEEIRKYVSDKNESLQHDQEIKIAKHVILFLEKGELDNLDKFLGVEVQHFDFFREPYINPRQFTQLFLGLSNRNKQQFIDIMSGRVFEVGKLRRSNWADNSFWKSTNDLLTEVLKKYQDGYRISSILIGKFSRLIMEEIKIDGDK